METENATPPTAKPKFTWYEYLWIGWPIGLVAVGGLIGGACGGAAWAINQKVFRATKEPVLRYLFTGFISVGFVFAYFAIAGVIYLLINGKH